MITRRTVIYALLALLIFIPALMLTPTMMSIHSVHQCRVCENRLKVLYGAMCAYEKSHGKYPDKLSQLYPVFIENLEAFECPAQRRRIRSPEEIDTLSGYVLHPPDPGEWGRKYNLKPLLCDHRRNHPFKWRGCWYDAVLYEDPNAPGMPTVFWMFDTRSVFPRDLPTELVTTNRYDFYNFPE